METHSKKSINKKHRDPDLAGAEVAMHRAAARARRRALETTGYVVVFKDGKIIKEIPRENPFV